VCPKLAEIWDKSNPIANLVTLTLMQIFLGVLRANPIFGVTPIVTLCDVFQFHQGFLQRVKFLKGVININFDFNDLFVKKSQKYLLVSESTPMSFITLYIASARKGEFKFKNFFVN